MLRARQINPKALLTLPPKAVLVSKCIRYPGLHFILEVPFPDNKSSGYVPFVHEYSSGGCCGFSPHSLMHFEIQLYYKFNTIYKLIQGEYYFFKVSSLNPDIKLIYRPKVKKKSDNLLIYL